MDEYKEFIEAGKLNNEELRILVIEIWGLETWKRARNFIFEKHYFPKNDNCDENYYEYALEINWIEDMRNELGMEAVFQIWIGKYLNEKAKVSGKIFIRRVIKNVEKSEKKSNEKK